jgi:penicillin-binding protein 1B
VVLAGLDALHPGTPLSNEPVSYDVGGKPWRPKNYDGSSGGNVRMRQALAESINLPIVDLAMRVGLEPVIASARQLGLSTPLEPRPSLALGAFEVVPLELARAYCAFAADGALPYPLAVREVLGHDGVPIERRHARVEPKLSPAAAYLMTSFLRSAVTDGTGRGLAKLGVDFPVAGKTGTTNGSRDAWFVGYTPELLALVWVGFDDGESVRASGSSAALPIWAELIKAIPWAHGRRWYDPPPGVLQAKVCAESGKLAVTGCPEPIEELFLETNAPDEPCHLHRDRTQLQRALDNLKGAFGL